MSAAVGVAIAAAVVAVIAMVTAAFAAIEAKTTSELCGWQAKEAERYVDQARTQRDIARQEFAKQCHQFAVRQAPEMWPGELSRQEGRRDG